MKLRVILYVISALLVGCGEQFTVDELKIPTNTPIVIAEKSASNEINSGSKPRYLTGGSYNVSSAVGNVSGKLSTETSGGYKVYLSVQGSVLSEEAQ